MPSLEPQEQELVTKETSTTDYEKLFLLEVMVINVYINDSSLQLDKEVISNFKETCVLFQFLNYPPLVVSEEDFCVFGSQAAPPESQLIFKSGKSCLFSLRSLKRPVMPMNFDITTSVAKKLQEGVLPNKLVIGKTVINMSGSFTRLMSENTDQIGTENPPAKILRDTFDFFDDKGNKVGDITVFIRLSCFGKQIITQFQIGEDQKEFYFKGDNTKAIKLPEEDKKEVGLYQGISVPPYGSQPNPPVPQRPSREGAPKESKMTPEFAGQQQFPGEKYPTDIGPYKIGGDERIQEDRWKRQQDRQPYYKEQYQDYMKYDSRERKRVSKQPPTLCPYAPKLNVCDCNYPIPLEIMPVCPGMQKKKKIRDSGSKDSFNLPPGGVGVCGDQVIFQMHKPGEAVSDLDKKMASSLLYKVGAVEGGQECPKQIVQILPQHPNEIPSPTDQEDVFILKIGKKVEGLEGKTNFEVELRTPKKKDPKPETFNQETQYLTADVAPTEKTGKKSKGGKGKKGKGKKK